MEELKLEEETLKELNIRKQAIMANQVLVKMATREMNLFVVEKLKEFKLDTTKQYSIDEKTGVISEVKAEPVKVENDNEEGGESKTEPSKE